MHKCSYPVKLGKFSPAAFSTPICAEGRQMAHPALTRLFYRQLQRSPCTVQKQTRSCYHSGHFILAILITKFLDTRLMFAYHVLELTKFPWDTLREWELGPHEWLTTQILSTKNVFPSNGSFASSKFQFVTSQVVAHLVLQLNTCHSLVRCKICLLCFCSM